MAYQWDSTLETGYEKVDNQHKQLVAALNALIEASKSGKGDKTSAIRSAIEKSFRKCCPIDFFGRISL